MQKLTLEGDLTIFSAVEQKTNLVQFLEQDDDLEIDLAKVEELDTAGLQLLILVKREAAHMGKKLRFTMHSKAVLTVLELTNLVTVFGDQVVLAHDEE